ncbi:MAG TPA: SagB/ThcOx family dehydrogenase [Phycisphaerae bacterium]|nr:SagB/ThcOx family dehydrogenase [Phycisphaerae bacterium]
MLELARLVRWIAAGAMAGSLAGSGADKPTTINLPKPKLTGEMSLEQAISQRRSVREFAQGPLTHEQLSQLCWAAQGITDARQGFRAAPSAGALYPLEIYLVTPDGLFRYKPAGHKLERLDTKDLRTPLYRAALEQAWIAGAPATMVITAVVQRTAAKYGDRAPRYCLLEAGHAAQNVLLQAVALGLGAVPVGAFEDQRVREVLHLPSDQNVFYLIPIGRPAM